MKSTFLKIEKYCMKLIFTYICQRVWITSYILNHYPKTPVISRFFKGILDQNRLIALSQVGGSAYGRGFITLDYSENMFKSTPKSDYSILFNWGVGL